MRNNKSSVRATEEEALAGYQYESVLSKRGPTREKGKVSTLIHRGGTQTKDWGGK